MKRDIWKIQAWTGFEPGYDLCDTGAVLYQLSYQTIWELVSSWVRNIPVEGEECSEHMKDHIFELRRKIWILHIYLYTQNKEAKEVTLNIGSIYHKI